MSRLDHLCPGCFASGKARPCPECGFGGEEDRPRSSLPALTILQASLVAGRLLGKPGSFGITYLGWDLLLERKVAIKEYLPRDLAGRDAGDLKVSSHSVEEERAFLYGREKFVEEARILARLDHPNIVRVQRFFEENGTAYLVMDYHDGTSLDQRLEGGKRLPEAEAVALLLPILEALSHIHAQKLVHRDVKPSNVYLKGGRTPILLDFGAARTALGERTRNLSVLLTPGYAPIEQYNPHGQLGPWTDVYAAAATLYRMLTGKAPLDANSRFEEDKLERPDQLVPGLSPRLSRAVLEGLAVKRQERPGSAEGFAGMLRKALEPPPVAPRPAPPASPPKPAPSPAVPKPAPSTAPPKPAPSAARPRPAPSPVVPKPAPSTPQLKPAPSPSAVAPKPAPSTSASRRASVGVEVSPVESLKYLMLRALKTLRSLLFRWQQPREQHAPAPGRTPRSKAPERPSEGRWAYVFGPIFGLLATLCMLVVIVGQPLAKSDHVKMSSGEEIVIPVLKNDGGLWLHLDSVGTASHGETRTGPGDAVTYVPSPTFSGEDKFSYTVTNFWGRHTGEVLVAVLSFKAGEVRRHADGLEYAWIPPGEFRMGCTPAVDAPCEENESPPHRVTLSRGFWLGTTEVTVGAFDRFLRRSKREEGTPLGPLKLPKVNVTWDEAVQFCRESGGRLPTEAQWEYAARGGKSQKYPWGNEEPVTIWKAHNGASFQPPPDRKRKGWRVEVGSFGANAFNLFDMAGNVLEWCLDTWHPSYKGAPSDGIAWLSQDRSLRVIRGGSWSDPASGLRVAKRFYGHVSNSNRLGSIGFRCARDVPPEEPKTPATPAAQ